MSPALETEQTFATATIAVINHSKLKQADVDEKKNLLRACEHWGFFYLDLGDSRDQGYLKQVGDVLDISKRYFDKPLSEKMKDTHKDMVTFNICGYKPMALDHGNVKDKKDGCEGLRIPADLCHEVDSNPTLSIPDGCMSDWPCIRSFAQASHIIANDVLSAISDAMDLHDEARFETGHKSDRSSTTTCVLQRYPHEATIAEDVSAGHFTHTDTGSITILFNTEWGLQVHSPDSEKWEWIPPHPTYAVVNIGDSLKFMSGLRLRSALHRVIPANDQWSQGARYAIIYFLRANDDVEFSDLEGKRWTAKDWLMRKFGGYRSSHAVQATNPVSTGKVGFLGLWADDRRATALA